MTDAGNPPGAEQAARAEVHELPFDRGTNAAARALLAEFVERKDLGTHVRQDAALVLGELVANGLDHGQPHRHRGLEVSWQLEEDCLQLSVLDGGGHTVPHVVSPDPYAPRGRGLTIVQALTRSWWVDDSNGTRVTAVVPLA